MYHTGPCRPKEQGGGGLAGSPTGAMVSPSVRGEMQIELQQELRGRSFFFFFICLGIYKSLTWYNDLIKRKQNTQRGWVSSLAPILPKRHTYERLGFGGLLSWNQYDAQKARLLCEQKEGSLPHTHTGGCGLSKPRPLESMGFQPWPGWCWVHVFSPLRKTSHSNENVVAG